jgi:uroporphyrinogen-III decarboxylase
MEFYSAIKKIEILLSAGKWTELENIIFSEVSQVQKAKGYIFSLICGIRPNTNISNIMKNRSH